MDGGFLGCGTPSSAITITVVERTTYIEVTTRDQRSLSFFKVKKKYCTRLRNCSQGVILNLTSSIIVLAISIQETFCGWVGCITKTTLFPSFLSLLSLLSA